MRGLLKSARVEAILIGGWFEGDQQENHPKLAASSPEAVPSILRSLACHGDQVALRLLLRFLSSACTASL